MTVRLVVLFGAALALVHFAILTGGIILNTAKKELPDESQRRFWTFAVGAVLYTVLLAVL